MNFDDFLESQFVARLKASIHHTLWTHGVVGASEFKFTQGVNDCEQSPSASEGHNAEDAKLEAEVCKRLLNDPGFLGHVRSCLHIADRLELNSPHEEFILQVAKEVQARLLDMRYLYMGPDGKALKCSCEGCKP